MEQKTFEEIMKKWRVDKLRATPQLGPREDVLRELSIKKRRFTVVVWGSLGGFATVAAALLIVLFIRPMFYTTPGLPPGVNGVKGIGEKPTQKAQELFKQALEIGKDSAVISADALNQKALLYRQAVEESPRYAQAWNNLGDVYENLGDFKESVNAYQNAIKAEPEWALPYFGIGDTCLRRGLYEKAEDWYKEGLKYETDPENKRLTQERLVYIEKILEGIEEAGIVRAAEIVSILNPPVVRGSGGLVEAPTITFYDSQIGFATDSAELLPQAKEQLDQLGIALGHEELAGSSFLIGGHADERPSTRFRDNVELSLSRARTVKDYLVNHHNVSPESLFVKGYGASYPIAFGHNEAAWAINRRVEIKKLDEEDVKRRNSDEVRSENVGIANVVCDVLFQDANGSWQVINNGDTVNSGDLYRIYLRPELNSYVYIYQKDASRGEWLFPKSNISLKNPLSGGIDYWIPSRDGSFKLDETVGEETIFIIASKERSLDLESLMEERSSSQEVVTDIKTRGITGSRPIQQNVSGKEMGKILEEAEFRKDITFIHR